MINQKHLSVMAYANGFTIWHYLVKSINDLKEVLKEDAFDNSKNILNNGDMIIITAKSMDYSKIAIFNIKNNTISQTVVFEHKGEDMLKDTTS